VILKLLSRRSRAWDLSWVLMSCLGVGLGLFYGCEGRLRRPIVALMRICLVLSFLFWVYSFCDLRETGTLGVCRYLAAMCRVVLVLARVHAATCM
jgi:hypothetical protein